MGKTLDEKIAELSPERQAKIRMIAGKLIKAALADVEKELDRYCDCEDGHGYDHGFYAGDDCPKCPPFHPVPIGAKVVGYGPKGELIFDMINVQYRKYVDVTKVYDDRDPEHDYDHR